MIKQAKQQKRRLGHDYRSPIQEVNQIASILEDRGFTQREANPPAGEGSFFHPRNGRKYNLDPVGRNVKRQIRNFIMLLSTA